jgi:autotransporter-associated beta strand protein
MRNLSRPARSALAMAVVLCLAACGGGGGGNVKSDPPPPPPPPPSSGGDDGGGSTTSQPGFSDHLKLTDDVAARAAGYTGAGVTIGFVDTGVNHDHPALAGRVDANFVHVDSSGNDLTVDDKVGHGTTVATLAAGAAFGQWPGGIAPDAHVVSSRIISDAPPADDGSGQGNEVQGGQGYGTFFAAVDAELADAGATIINNSWGGLYWSDPDVTTEFADAYRDFVVTRGGLIVFANGNAGADARYRPNPSDNAALPSKDGGVAADLEVGWLAVGALDTLHPTQLASYSQECGVAMDYCLVAPGDVVFTGADDTAGNPTYWVGSGTSFAAPLVSGAAAVVWSAFPYFDNDLVRQTLLGTAKDLGAPGVDTVFGHGLLDVGKAVKGPARFDWGDVTVSFSGSSTWSNAISGAGGLVKQGSGTLVLTEDSTYTGDTRVEGGVLELGNGMTGSDFVVGAAGTLRGRATIQGSVSNAGHVLASASSGTTMQVAGNYAQAATGTLDAYLGRGLQVGGTATLDGTLNVVGVASGYTASAREGILHADGGVSGAFATLTSSNTFMDATLEYDPDDVFLDITRLDVSLASQSMGLTAASQSGAVRVEDAFRALDAGAQATVAPAFLQAAGALQRTQGAASAERSLSSLSGELHATDAAIALLAADGGRRALESRLDASRPAGAWSASLDGRHGLGSAFGSDLRGWALGQEFRSGDTTWGMGFSRSEGTLWNSGRRDRSHDVQAEGQLYAARTGDGGGYLLGRAAFGRMQRDLQREIVLGASDYGVDSRYADRYWTASLQAGQRFGAFGGTLVPYAGVQVLELQRGAFAEDGAAGFGLRAEASRFARSQGLLGTRYARGWRIGGALLDLHARAEWQRRLSQSGAIEASFTGVDASAPIALDLLGRDVGLLGAGVGADWGNASLSLDVDARSAAGRRDLGASANWRWSF